MYRLDVVSLQLTVDVMTSALGLSTRKALLDQVVGVRLFQVNVVSSWPCADLNRANNRL